MKMCTRILWFWQPVRGLKAVRASQSTSAGWEGIACGGQRGGCAASPSGRTNYVPPSCCQLPPPNLLALPDERNPP